MAIGLEEKKSSLLKKILIALLAVSAIFALFFFGAKTDIFKKISQPKEEPASEIKKVDIDFAFLNLSIISDLKSFPSFPSFFGSSSSPVDPGRENPFISYKFDTASGKKATTSEAKGISKQE